jgi:hypothetical protein
MRIPFAIATVVMGGASIVLVRAAHACWPGPCQEARLLPESGATIPQNVAGFPFRPGPARSTSSSDEDIRSETETVTLKDAAGRPVATSLKSMSQPSTFDQLVVPSAPLPPGRYSLEFPNLCIEAKKETRSFTIVPAQPYPTQIGTLRAVRSAEGTVTVEAPAQCVVSRKADSVSIAINPSPAFAAFQSVAIFTVLVDGKSWKGPVTKYRGGWPNNFDPFSVYALCGGQSSWGGGGQSPLELGHHVVEVRAHIEGAPSDPAPAKIEIDLSCPSAT